MKISQLGLLLAEIGRLEALDTDHDDDLDSRVEAEIDNLYRTWGNWYQKLLDNPST